MKILPRGFRMLAPLVMLLVMNIGCARKQVPAQNAQTQSSPAKDAQGQSPQLKSAQAPGAQAQNPPPQSVESQGPQSQAAQPQAAPQPGSAIPANASATNPAQTMEQPPAITIPRGSRLVVRMGQTIDVKHAVSGERFTGTVAEPVVVGNTVAIPSGSTATGEVLVARRRGRFKGRSELALTLTRLEVNGTGYRVETSNLTRTKKGKGKRTAAMIGGGAGLGMLIGGVATGGVGLLVGGLAGGGAGTLTSAFTGNRDIAIPAESVISFRMEHALTLAPDAQQAEAR